MIDLGILNNILDSWCSILSSENATVEEKENALAKAKEVRDEAENKYTNQLDRNGDKLLTEEDSLLFSPFLFNKLFILSPLIIIFFLKL